MSIVDRVKIRTETDWPDAEIQLLVDEVNQDVINRFGPHADPSNPITVMVEGNREKIVLDRPIDITETIVVTEYYDWWSAGESTYVCQAIDYRIWAPYNVTVQRRFDGGSAIPNLVWGDRVKFTYTPVNDGDQREEVMVKLVILAIQYDAFSQQSVGDVSGQTGDYIKERERLFQTLAPKRGVGLL